MDVGLNEAQELLKRSARETLKTICPPALVRAAEADPASTDALWSQFADLGWLGLPFPEAAGGAGEDLLTLLVLVEELGYAAAPGPYLATVCQAGTAINLAGTSDERQQLLGAIARGELTASLAVAEPGPRFIRQSYDTVIRQSGFDTVLNGVKSFVPAAELARLFVVAARPVDSALDDGAVNLVLVDRDDPGVTVETQRSLAGEPLGIVRFKDVRLRPDPSQVKSERPVLEATLARAALADAAYQVGAMQRAFELAVSWAKERVAFGRPIGSFQAIAHKCADMAVDLDASRLLLHRAAWVLDEGIPEAGTVAMAKLWAGEAGQRVMKHAHQIHGAIGFTTEYDLNLYTRRIKSHEFAFGRPDEHAQAVARGVGVRA